MTDTPDTLVATLMRAISEATNSQDRRTLETALAALLQTATPADTKYGISFQAARTGHGE